MALEQFTDYFSEISLDITKFNIDNDIQYPNVQPIEFKLLDLFDLYKVDLDEIQNLLEEYTLDDNDRPDLLAKRVYGDSNLWWLNLFINQRSYFDLPLKDEKLHELATYLYNNEYKYSSVSKYYDILKEKNEAKRTFKVVKKKYLYALLRQIYGKLENER